MACQKYSYTCKSAKVLVVFMHHFALRPICWIFLNLKEVSTASDRQPVYLCTAFDIDMGRKGKETTVEERKIVMHLHNQCKSLQSIADTIGRPRSTVQSIIHRYCQRNTVQNMPRSGRPRLVTGKRERLLMRIIKKNSRTSAHRLAEEMANNGQSISASTARRVSKQNGYNGCVARKKFFVSETNRKKRLSFAKQYVNKDPAFWNKVIFSDESKFNIFGSDG